MYVHGVNQQSSNINQLVSLWKETRNADTSRVLYLMHKHWTKTKRLLVLILWRLQLLWIQYGKKQQISLRYTGIPYSKKPVVLITVPKLCKQYLKHKSQYYNCHKHPEANNHEV